MQSIFFSFVSGFLTNRNAQNETKYAIGLKIAKQSEKKKTTHKTKKKKKM